MLRKRERDRERGWAIKCFWVTISGKVNVGAQKYATVASSEGASHSMNACMCVCVHVCLLLCLYMFLYLFALSAF